MSETYWPRSMSASSFNFTNWLAMTFRPRHTHTCHTIRIKVGFFLLPMGTIASIQYLKPDGTPTGVDLGSVRIDTPILQAPLFYHTAQVAFPPTYLVAGIAYALVLKAALPIVISNMFAGISSPPSGYPRGHLITTMDSGTTWDTSDHGALHFAEFGDPPVYDSRYTPPIRNMAVIDWQEQAYYSYMCIRISTSEPCHLWCYKSDKEPGKVVGWKNHRGLKLSTLKNLYFYKHEIYNQKEKDDSIFHTFLIKGLTDGEPYWFTFIGEADFKGLLSRTFIYKVIHQAGPSFTKTLRPNTPGDYCRIWGQVGAPCPNHYLNINEHTPDEDASYNVNNMGWTSWNHDLYSLPDASLPAGLPIKELHIAARVRGIGGMHYAPRCRILVKTHGTVFIVADYHRFGLNWVNLHTHIPLNPSTNEPWTPNEIDNLQIGISLRCYVGVGWTTDTACTQLYAKVYHACEADE